MVNTISLLGSNNIFGQYAKVAQIKDQAPSAGQSSFGDVLKNTLLSEADQMRTNERLTDGHTLGEGDLTKLTTKTAMMAANVEIYTALREKIAGAYNELVKMTI